MYGSDEMIIALSEAQNIDSSLNEDDLLGLEIAIREITNNNFQNNRVRFKVKEVIGSNSIITEIPVVGIREGDRIELNNSAYNNNLHTVKELDGNTIKVTSDDLYVEKNNRLIITKVVYPPDVKVGVKKLLEYDKKTAKNIGIKSRTISRMSETYYDVTSGENVNGYPSSLFEFIRKYKKMRWGG